MTQFAQAESCVRETNHWMACNKLKLNRDKTELLVIGSKHWPYPVLDSIPFDNCRVCPSIIACNAGVFLEHER